MPKIKQLERHVADLIAAGEVVERPASVIKELMENSIDAGAGIITVEIKSGGMTYIRVTDDGCGLSPADAEIAFLRHATSKIRDAEDLEAIGTLGFRGEALAAISSVSKIELITREKGAETGTRVEIEAGDIISSAPWGCPEGTTIIVRNLFYNTPARQKFMKSDRAEASSAYSTVMRCALSRPEVSVRFIKDDKTECHTPGDNRVDSCLYSLFGREFALDMIKADSGDDAISVSGYISPPGAARGNRNYQFFFVNGRYIKSRTLQAALEQAYSSVIMSGRYPACALYIKTGLGAVDANVHPAKTEVRFLSDKQVFDGVYYTVLGALERSGGAQAAKLSLTPSEGTAALFAGTTVKNVFTTAEQVENKGGFKTTAAENFRNEYNSGGGFVSKVSPVTETTKELILKDETFGLYKTRRIDPPLRGGEAESALEKQRILQRETQQEPQDDESGGIAPLLDTEPPRVIGEAFSTYIIVQKRDSIWFIDKHAAHERICYDKLTAEVGAVMMQDLIKPVICRMGVGDAEILLENAELLRGMGFVPEDIGGGSIALRAIPADIDIGDAEEILSEICAEQKRGSASAVAAWRVNVLKTMACKAAVKAGDITDRREYEVLAERVLSGELRFCPHGRPVAVEITRQNLERGFKRT